MPIKRNSFGITLIEIVLGLSLLGLSLLGLSLFGLYLFDLSLLGLYLFNLSAFGPTVLVLPNWSDQIIGCLALE